MTAWVLQVFIMVPGLGSLAKAGNLHTVLTVDRLATSVARTSPTILLAASTTGSNPFDFNTNPGRMPAGAGMFGPQVGAIPEEPGSFPIFFPDQGAGYLGGPRGSGSLYRRCPWGGFDCDL